MTDRELLEMAAKAAGVKYIATAEDGARFLVDMTRWNPLTDDEDALRLAVKFSIFVDINHTYVQAEIFDGKKKTACQSVSVDGDPCAATRRAIVCAVAEIGRNMP